MATTPKTPEHTTERIRDINERILESTKRAGNSYVDAYEKSLVSIADQQQSLAEQTSVEWVSTVVDAQARLTREVAKAQTAAARDMLK
ncbi:MAG: hypothetical protein M3P44_11030 [Actinomycetota bacterium]|nr:hypothetical protein [Actinomycetota bacterium]